MSENENFNIEAVNASNDKSVKALNGVSIASIVLSAIGIVFAIITLVFFAQSFVAGAEDNPGSGMGIAFNVLFMAIFAIIGGAIGAVSLILGTVSLSKAKDNKQLKSKAIAGTVLSAMAIAICLLAFVIRLII